jgi:hypothetical protein
MQALPALGVDGKEADVSLPLRDRIDRLRGGVKHHQIQRTAQAVGKGARQVDRHARHTRSSTSAMPCPTPMHMVHSA